MTKMMRSRLATFAAAIMAASVAVCSGSASVARADASGTMDDWLAAVCQPGSYKQSSYSPVICNGYGAERGGFRSMIFFNMYTSQADMQADRVMWNGEFGHAVCAGSGGRIAAVKPDVSGVGSRSDAITVASDSLQPLKKFGCAINGPSAAAPPVGQPPAGAPGRPPTITALQGVQPANMDEVWQLICNDFSVNGVSVSSVRNIFHTLYGGQFQYSGPEAGRAVGHAVKYDCPGFQSALDAASAQATGGN